MSNDGHITYNHGAIAASAGEITSASKYFHEVLDQLQSDVNSLGSEWAGDFAVEYRQYQDQWNRAGLALKQLLTEIGAAVASGNDRMQDTDRRLAAGWAR